MAKETKVGLLVGLAFIVCFAVILANRGREQFIDAQIPDYIVQKPRTDTGPASTAVTPSPRTSTTYDSSGRAIVQHMPDRGEAQLPGGARLGGGDSLPGGSPDPRGGHDLHMRRGDTADADTQSPEDKRRRLEEMLSRIAAQVHADRSGEGGSAEPPQYPRGEPPIIRPVEPPVTPASEEKGRSYVVQRGDSLSKIAQKNYGSQARSVIDLIYAANRSNMSSPNDIKAGATIVLPEMPGENRKRADAIPTGGSEALARREPAPTKPDPAAEREKKTLTASAKRWYVVRENDRYASIAREQLGDESRWREIHELNKDKFPNPDRIRPGVRIQIPTGNAVSARE